MPTNWSSRVILAGTIPLSWMHGLGGIAETRLEVFPDVTWVRRDPGTGGNREDPGTLEEKNTVSETTIASDTRVERIFAGPY